MKKIITFLLLLLTGSVYSQLSNTFKYVIKANGGVEVPVNTFKIGTIMVTRTGTQLNYIDIGSSLQGLLNAKVAVADTASMLTPYINHNDTIALMEHYAKNTSVALKLSKSDTAAMLTPYINHNDTVAMLTHYAKLSGVQTITGTVLNLPKINENVEVTANSTEINILDNIEPNLIYIGDIAYLKTEAVLTADYVIEKIASTYYARPSGSYTAYSDADATVVIRGALGQLTTGGRIFIKAGTYDNLDSLTILYDNVTIEGAGKYTTILKAKAGLDVGKTNPTGLLRVYGANNFTLKNIELDGNGVNQTKIDNQAGLTAELSGVCTWEISNVASDNIVVSNCYIHDFPQFGVVVDKSNNGVIEYCDLRDNYWNNINLGAGTAWFRVYNCYTEGSGDMSISTQGNGNIIQNNFITNVDGVHGSGNQSWGIGIETLNAAPAVHQTLIVNNIITGANLDFGIFAANAPEDCLISGNTIYGMSTAWSSGIAIHDGAYMTISNNKIKDVNGGIYLTGTTYSLISGNDVLAITTADGLVVEGSSTNNRILNNNLSGIYGLYIEAASNNNILIGNVIKGTVSGSELDDAGTGTKKHDNYLVTEGTWATEN